MKIEKILLNKLKEVTHPMKLKYPFDEEIKPFIYSSKDDEDGYASWSYKKKEEKHELNLVSKLINQKLHEDLLWYCNSYWFLSFEGKYEGRSTILTPVIPTFDKFYFEKEILHYYGNVQKLLLEKEIKDIEFIKGMIYIGLIDDFLEIYFCNLTGEVYTCDFDLKEFVLLEKDLGTFLEKINL